MKFSEVVDRKVVSTSTATTMAYVKELLVDPASRKVVALTVRKGPSKGAVLPWSALTAFGQDAVTVVDAEAFSAPDDEVSALLGKDHELQGKRVLTEDGEDIGTVADVEFDPSSGAITAIQVGAEPHNGGRLLGVGSYAVVLRRA